MEYVIFFLITRIKIMYMHFHWRQNDEIFIDSSAHVLSDNFHIGIFTLRVFVNTTNIFLYIKYIILKNGYIRMEII